jgi:DNA helicase HerA-like ATPase
MPDIIGRTCWVETVGPGYDHVPFVLDSGHDVRLYELLFVRDGRREYYGRVVAGEERNLDATAERLRREKAMAYDSGPRRDDDFMLVRTHHLEILGQVVRERGRISIVEPDFLPETKAEVIRPDDAELVELVGLPQEGYRLGRVLMGRELEFRLDHRAPARHIGIFGRPGSGKSYLGGVLIEEFVARHMPIVSFDVNGELQTAVGELGGVNLTPGRDFRVPIRFLDHREFLESSPSLTDTQEQIVLDAFMELRDDPAMNDTFEIDDLINHIGVVATALGQAPVGQRAAQKMRRLHIDPILGDRRPNGQPINVGVRTAADWEQLFRAHPCVNIFVGRLPGRRRETVVAAVCRLLQRLRQRDLVPPFGMVLDEAHFFVPSGSHGTSTDVVRDFIRVGRHGPMGTVLISQSPSGIDRQILLLLNTIFAFALTGEDVRSVSDFMADAPDELVRRIPLMRSGTAVVGAAKDILRHAMLVRVRERQTTHAAPTVDLAVEAVRWLEERADNND